MRPRLRILSFSDCRDLQQQKSAAAIEQDRLDLEVLAEWRRRVRRNIELRRLKAVSHG
jgi:hypothetical protein